MDFWDYLDKHSFVAFLFWCFLASSFFFGVVFLSILHYSFEGCQ